MAVKPLLMTVIVLLPAAQAAPDAPKQAPRLGPRYRNALHGFSIRPPAGTERVLERSVRRVVEWTRRDEGTGKIRWSVEILRTRQQPTKLPLSAYAKVVAKELGRANSFIVDSTQVGVVAGKPAMHFRGIWRGPLRLWRRQTWVQLSPEEHLVLNVFGDEAEKPQLDAMLTAMAGTLELFDPAEARKQRGRSLDRGAAVLEGLTEARLAGVLDGQTSYFLVQLSGQVVGFIRGSEAMARRHDLRGLWVVRVAALKLPAQPRQLLREELFATADRGFERWRRITLVGQTAAAVRTVEEAVKQNDLILLHTRHMDEPRKTRQFRLPKAIAAAYLPAAMAVVAPRLIDRAVRQPHGFAVFNAAAGGFDLRTLQVAGAGTVTLDEKRIKTARLRDRPADDAAESDLWVDDKGALVLAKTPDGTIVSRSDRAAVVRRFAAELLALEQLAGKPPVGATRPK